MPFTGDQLVQYFTALNGVAPSLATRNAFFSAAQQNQAGSLSDQATLALVFNDNSTPGTVGTFEVIESTYQFFTGASTSQAGLAFLRGDAGSGNTTGLNNAFYAGFNTENRYYNFAINLASSGGAGNASFLARYGSLTFQQTVASAYEEIVGASNVGTANAAAAIADITSRQAFFTQIAATRAGGVDAGGAAGQNVALKAIVVGYILQEANKASVGTYANALNQFEAAVSAGNAIYNTNVLNTYGPGGAGFGIGIGGTGTVGGTQTNFALTPGTDVPNLTSGNIQYVGAVSGGANPADTTLNPSDQIRATGGNNTLTVTVSGGFAGDALNGALVSGVDTVNLRGNATPVTLNASNVPAVTAINSFLSNSAITITNVAGSTTVGFVGNGTATGGSLTANFISGTTANVLVQNGTQAGTSLTIGSAAAGAAGTVNLTSAGALNTLDNLALPAATTTLSITANSQFAVTGVGGVGGTTAAGLATLNVTGSAAVNLGPTALGGAAGAGTIRTVTASNAGGLTASFASPATAALSITTGTGPDSITIDRTLANTVVNTGGGADTLTVNGPIAAGSTLNGGGAGTLSTLGASFQTVSTGFTVAQRALVTGFSTVGITDALATGALYDVNTIGAPNFTTIGVATGGTATLNAAPGSIVTFNGGNGANNANNGTLNVNLAGATQATQTNDVLNVGAINQNGPYTLNLNTFGVETVNVTANRTATAPAGTSILTANIASAATRAYTFAGNESFVFAPIAAHTVLTSIVSTSTGNANIDVQAISNFNLGGGQVSNGTATANITLTTGTGADALTVRDFVRVTAGAGADQVNALTVSTGQTYSTFVDSAANDRIFLTGATETAAAAAVRAKIVLNSGASFQDYLDAATRTTVAAGSVNSFDFNFNDGQGLNTFLVAQSGGGNTFENGVDNVIRLIGTHTVGSIAAGVVTLGS